jgi:hypothetical protein
MSTSDPVLTVAELEKLHPNYRFRYTSPQSKTKHAVRTKIGSDEIASDYASAPCGRSPVWFSPVGWMGTGSQEEYERNDALPLCKRCGFMLTNGSMTHQVKSVGPGYRSRKESGLGWPTVTSDAPPTEQ